MTEFQVCAAYILVPLFLFIPLLGKYFDIKHSTINAARYQAWEYTVWYNSADDHKLQDSFNAARLPYKSPARTATETQRRFFSAIREGNQAIGIDGRAWNAEDRNPLWTDHRGNPLFVADELGTDLRTFDDTPGPEKFASFNQVFGMTRDKLINIDLEQGGSDLSRFMDGGFELLNDIFGLDNDPEFDAVQFRGYARGSVTAPIVTFPDAVKPEWTDLSTTDTGTADITARAGVLGDGWNAGGKEHAYVQVKGAAPVTAYQGLYGSKAMKIVWDVVGFMAPELTRCKPGFSPAVDLGYVDEDGSLWLGYIDSDTVHPDRLAIGGKHVCDDAGRCRLEPNKTPGGGTFRMAHRSCVP